ncbi:MAG: hypothetical protein R3D70_23580 [Rhizobiaceae bacterium]
MNDLRCDARRQRDEPTLGKERDEPASPSRILPRHAVPSPDPSAMTMMTGEAIDRVLADIVQLQACAENPGREVTGGIRIAPDRQAAIALSCGFRGYPAGYSNLKPATIPE